MTTPDTTFKLNRDQTVAIDPDYYWREMGSCPIGVTLQLLGAGGVATHSSWDGRDPFWVGWTPLPKKRN